MFKRLFWKAFFPQRSILLAFKATQCSKQAEHGKAFRAPARDARTNFAISTVS